MAQTFSHEKLKGTPSASFFSLSFRPWGLLIAAGLIACLATLLGFLGRFAWVFDLFAHFRVQYMLGLLVLGVLLLIGRRRGMAAMFFAVASVNMGLVLPLYMGKQDIPPEASPPLRAMLINVNTRLGDPDRVKAVIVSADPDILVLEEIDFRWISALAWLTNAYPHSLIQPREDNFGIGIYSKLSFVDREVRYIGSAEVPSILATINTGDTHIRVIATHPLPPAGRDYSRWRNEQLDRIPDHIPSDLPVLLLGDLNVSPWSHHFRRLLARSGLRDSSRGYGFQPTWPNFNPLLWIPIDHCLHSSEIIVVDRRIGEDVSSDHYPLIVDFVIHTKVTD